MDKTTWTLTFDGRSYQFDNKQASDLRAQLDRSVVYMTTTLDYPECNSLSIPHGRRDEVLLTRN